MDLLQSVYLGVLQGLTEFLPVSSSGHLAFFELFWGIDKPMMLFNIGVHFATLFAICIYFKEDLQVIIKESVQGIPVLLREKSLNSLSKKSPHLIWLIGILITTFVTGVLALLMRSKIEAFFASYQMIGIGFFASCFILIGIKRLDLGKKEVASLSWKLFALIGVFQAIAVLPGVSRSGITLLALLWLKVNKEEAFKYTFLVSIPVIILATLLEAVTHPLGSSQDWLFLFTGMIAAFISGYAALHVFSNLLEKRRLTLYILYLAAIGYTCVTFYIV